MVEGARLESVFTGNRNEGSNPSLTAIHVGGLCMAQTFEALGLLMIGLAKNGAGARDFAMRVDIG